jgi:hypothetical protein
MQNLCQTASVILLLGTSSFAQIHDTRAGTC